MNISSAHWEGMSCQDHMNGNHSCETRHKRVPVVWNFTRMGAIRVTRQTESLLPINSHLTHLKHNLEIKIREKHLRNTQLRYYLCLIIVITPVRCRVLYRNATKTFNDSVCYILSVEQRLICFRLSNGIIVLLIILCPVHEHGPYYSDWIILVIVCFSTGDYKH